MRRVDLLRKRGDKILPMKLKRIYILKIKVQAILIDF